VSPGGDGVALPADSARVRPYGAIDHPVDTSEVPVSVLDPHPSTRPVLADPTDPTDPSDPSEAAAAARSGDHHGATALLVVRPWWDPGLAVTGFDPRSAYVERFWTGVLGPSVILLMRRFARGLEEHPAGFQIALADTARAIGLGGGTGRQAPINRTLDRACTFSMMRRTASGELQVRTHVPRVSERQLARLPLAVRSSHDSWLAHPANQGPGVPRAA